MAAVAATLVVAAACADEVPTNPPVLGEAADPMELRGGNGGEPFAFLRMFFEYNSTDDDLGVQVHLDADEWVRVAGFDPSNRPVLDVAAHGRLRELGLTELFFESAEPSPAEVLALFPAGTYGWAGRTVDNVHLFGEVQLSHQLPPAPVFTPVDGAETDPDNTIIDWQPIPGMAYFQVIVEDETTGRSMTVELGPNATSLQVPPEFLAPGGSYKIEVIVVSPNGNKTITEHEIETAE
jgi:hypothetical protein